MEDILNWQFINKDLLQIALTHRSYLNEHQSYKNGSNERLEFLGDAILQFLVSEFLFLTYPHEPEGALTNFRAATVCTPSLAAESERLGFGKFLLMSYGEEQSGGRNKEYILANTFEAVLGAIYLDDHNLDFCREYLNKNLFYKIDEIVKLEKYRDAKSHFQELSQEKKGITPAYKVISEEGPDHNKCFIVGVFLGSTKISEGSGNSKQRAEQAAAQAALEKWENKS